MSLACGHDYTLCRLIAQAVAAGSLHEAERDFPECAADLRRASDQHRANVALLAALVCAEGE